MGFYKDTRPEPGWPPGPSQFTGDTVLARMARGNYQPTEADLGELRRLLESGNRAERRAAARHLKKHGVAVPAAAPSPPLASPPGASNPLGKAERPLGASNPSGKAERLTPPAPQWAPAVPEHPERKTGPSEVEATGPGRSAKASTDAAAARVASVPKRSAAKTAARRVAAKKAASAKAVDKEAGSKTAATKKGPTKAAPEKTAPKKTAAKKAAGQKSPKKAAAKKTAS